MLSRFEGHWCLDNNILVESFHLKLKISTNSWLGACKMHLCVEIQFLAFPRTMRRFFFVFKIQLCSWPPPDQGHDMNNKTQLVWQVDFSADHIFMGPTHFLLINRSISNLRALSLHRQWMYIWIEHFCHYNIGNITIISVNWSLRSMDLCVNWLIYHYKPNGSIRELNIFVIIVTIEQYVDLTFCHFNSNWYIHKLSALLF